MEFESMTYCGLFCRFLIFNLFVMGFSLTADFLKSLRDHASEGLRVLVLTEISWQIKHKIINSLNIHQIVLQSIKKQSFPIKFVHPKYINIFKLIMALKAGTVAEWIHKGSTPEIVFGNLTLKPLQKSILNCIQTHDAIVNLPTGFGKSLLYQYPASKMKHNKECVLIVVPLRALLWDAVREATQLGINAKELDISVINDFYKSDLLPQLLVVTPEKIFATELVQNFLESLHYQNCVQLVVIDECHCICEWGHDFRPAYLKLKQIRNIFPEVRVLAMSATIPPEIKKEIGSRLVLMNTYYFQASYHRPNLHYSVNTIQKKGQIQYAVRQFLRKNDLFKQSGIIYCQTIVGSQKLGNELKDLSIGVFHSKLSECRRKQIYDGFINGSIKIIIGTICFGMGINKKNIRYVLHVGVSKSPENYYQESGRAGRDGIFSHCSIIAYPGMINSLHYLISKAEGKKTRKRHQLFKLNQIKNFAEEQVRCRRKNLFETLGEDFPQSLCKKHCDNCESGRKPSKMIVKDFYEPIMQFMGIFSEVGVYLTKIQLLTLMKGKSGKIISDRKRKFFKQFDKLQKVKGLFKQHNQETVKQIIQQMIRSKLLIQHLKKVHHVFVEYYKPAHSNFLKRIKKFEVSLPQQLPETKKITYDKFDRFDKLLKRKNSKVQDNDKQEEKKEEKKEEKAQQKTEQKAEELVEAKVIKQEINHEVFFSELYGEELDIDLSDSEMPPKQQMSKEDEVKSEVYMEEEEPHDLEIEAVPEQNMKLDKEAQQKRQQKCAAASSKKILKARKMKFDFL